MLCIRNYFCIFTFALVRVRYARYTPLKKKNENILKMVQRLKFCCWIFLLYELLKKYKFL